MIMVECTRCGEDCSNAYGTYLGYPYHITCLPMSRSDVPLWTQHDFDHDDEEAEHPAQDTNDE